MPLIRCPNIGIKVLRLLEAAPSSTPDSIARISIWMTLEFLLLETFLPKFLSDKCLAYGYIGFTKYKEIISEWSRLACPFPDPLLFQEVCYASENGFAALAFPSSGLNSLHRQGPGLHSFGICVAQRTCIVLDMLKMRVTWELTEGLQCSLDMVFLLIIRTTYQEGTFYWHSHHRWGNGLK